jgi:hypothetical protein
MSYVQLLLSYAVQNSIIHEDAARHILRTVFEAAASENDTGDTE